MAWSCNLTPLPVGDAPRFLPLTRAHFVTEDQGGPPADLGAIKQCHAFALACVKKWGLPPLTKIVIECEVGEPMRVYAVMMPCTFNRTDASVLLESVADVSVEDGCRVVAVPHPPA